MSIIDNEKLAEQEISTELYEIVYHEFTYRYTSYHSNLYVGNNAFPAIPMERSTFTIGADLDIINLNITLYFRGTIFEDLMEQPGDPIVITIKKCLVSNPLDNYTLFKGSVLGVSFNNEKVSLSVLGGAWETQKKIPSVYTQSYCNNILFDDTCTLEKNDYKIQAKVFDIVSNLISCINYLPDSFGNNFEDVGTDYFARGIMRYAGEYRYITKSFSSSLNFYVQHNASSNLSIGDVVSLWPGCDKSPNVCSVKFDNLVNFVGMPYIPSIDPLRWGVKTT